MKKNSLNGFLALCLFAAFSLLATSCPNSADDSYTPPAQTQQAAPSSPAAPATTVPAGGTEAAQEIQYITFKGSVQAAGAMPASYAKAVDDLFSQSSAASAIEGGDLDGVARSASPNVTVEEGGDLEFFATATAREDGTVVNGYFESAASSDFEMALSVGKTWDIVCGVRKKSDSKVVLQDTYSKQVTVEDSVLKHNFELLPAQEGSGSVELTVNFSTPVAKVEARWENAYAGVPALTLNPTDGKPSPVKISAGDASSASGVPSGNYNIVLSFKDANNISLYESVQTVTVMNGMPTNAWTLESGEGAISQPGDIVQFSVGSDLIKSRESGCIYVGVPADLVAQGVTASATNKGGAYSPLNSLDAAFKKIKSLGNKDKDFQIFVSGEVSGNSTIDSDITASANAKSITIQGLVGNASDSLKGDGTASVLTIGSSVPVTLKNIKITGGGGALGGGICANAGSKLTIESGTLVTGNSAEKGGGLNLAASGTVLMKGGEIKANTASQGGAVYVESGANLKISGSAKIAGGAEAKNDVYLTLDGDGNYSVIQISGALVNAPSKDSEKIAVTAVEWRRKKTVVKAADDSGLVDISSCENFFKASASGVNLSFGGNDKKIAKITAPYYVSSSGVDDDPNCPGTKQNPFRTLGYAVTRLSGGDKETIFVDGTLEEGQNIPSSFTKSMCAALTIKGAASHTINESPTDAIDAGGTGIALTINAPSSDGDTVPITIENLKITGGNASSNTTTSAYGGGVTVSKGSLTLSDGAWITKNKGSANVGVAGGVGVAPGAKLFMRGRSLIGNKVSSAPVSEDACLAAGGNIRAVGYGGGIINRGSTFIGCDEDGNATDACKLAEGYGVIGNYSMQDGGGIANEGILKIGSGEVSCNIADNYSGGGVYQYKESGTAPTLLITGGKIRANKAKNNGGGLYIQTGTATMSDGTIGGPAEADGNEANDGGGVEIHYGCSFTMTDGTVAYNKANNEGGGVYIWDEHSGTPAGIFNMQGGTIENNSADGSPLVYDKGGAVYVYGTFNISGAAYIPSGVKNADNTTATGEGKNDVYIKSGKEVYAAGVLTKGIGAITPHYATGSPWKRGTKVVSAANEGAASSAFGKINVVDTEWKVFVNPGATTQGVIDTDFIYVASSSPVSGSGISAPPAVAKRRGTKAAPYAKIEEAVEQCWNSDKDFIIKVSGEIKNGASEEIPLENTIAKTGLAQSITIEGANSDNSKDFINRGLTEATKADGGSALTIENKNPITIKNLKITGGATTGSGGGINAESSDCKMLTLGDGALVCGNFSNNNGGGVYISGASSSGRSVLVMTGTSRVGENKASYSGGGVYLKWANFYMSGSAVIGKKASDTASSESACSNYTDGNGIYYRGGAGVYCNGSRVYLGYASDGSTSALDADAGVLYNYAGNSGAGGGIYNKEGCVWIASGSVSNNGAETNGGGMYTHELTSFVTNAALFMSGGSVSKNKASNGGGMYVEAKNAIYMYGSALVGGSASSAPQTDVAAKTAGSNIAKTGAGIYNAGDVYLGYTSGTASSTLTPATGDNAFTGGVNANYISEANGSGAGIYNTNVLCMNSGNVSYNGTSGASGHGAGVYNASTFTMSGGSIKSNKCGGSGGLGSGVNQASGAFNVKGKACVDGDNDVYLPSGKYITVTGAIDDSISKVAKIRPSAWRGTQILYTTISSGFTDAITNKFDLTEDGWDKFIYKTTSDNDSAKIDADIYVAGTGAVKCAGYTPKDTDNTSGNWAHPFKTIGAALALLDADHKTIVVDGTLSAQKIEDTATIPTGVDVVTVKGYKAVSDTTSAAKITGAGSKQALSITKAAEYTIKDLQITAGMAATFGGGIFLGVKDAVLNLESGAKVYDNKAKSNGAGVYIVSGATLNVKDGSEIYGNKAVDGNSIKGGGVYVSFGSGSGATAVAAGALNISGGCIYNNSADKGGGIYNDGTVTMTGGKIGKKSNGDSSPNTATTSGGAVYQDAAFSMSGGVTFDAGSVKSNDIYLLTTKFITLPENDFTLTGSARITPSKWSRGKQVLDGSYAGTHASKFSITDSEWKVVADSSVGKLDTTSSTIYVSSSGNDTTGRGTESYPYATIQTAAKETWKAQAYTISVSGTLTANSTSTLQSIPNDASVKATSITLSGTNSATINANSNGSALAINKEGVSVTITNIKITGGSATNGGGILVNGVKGASLKLSTGANVTANTASSNGGGVYFVGTSASGGTANLIMDSTAQIGGNTASSNGGGVYLSYANLCMNGNALIGDASGTSHATSANNGYSNKATNGAGVYIANSGSSVWLGYAQPSDADISKSTLSTTYGIRHNYASTSGGGIYNKGGSITFDTGEISFNGTAGSASSGGGISIALDGTTAGVLNLKGGKIKGNYSYDGGGVYSEGKIVMTGGTIGDKTYPNEGVGQGGGVTSTNRFTMSGGLIGDDSNSYIAKNQTGSYANKSAKGAGLCLSSSQNTYVSITSGSIEYNYATSSGGGIYLGSGWITIGCNIARNGAYNGGGVYSSDYDFTLKNAEFASNKADNAGGACYLEAKENNRTITFDGSTSIPSSAAKNNDVYLNSDVVSGKLARICGSPGTMDGTDIVATITPSTYTSRVVCCTSSNNISVVAEIRRFAITPQPSGQTWGIGDNGYLKTIIGTKSKPTAVGDIVFSDGSARSYEPGMTLTTDQQNKAIAFTIYAGKDCNNEGETGNRYLAVGRAYKNNNTTCWCITSANAHTGVFNSIACSYSGSYPNYTFSGVKNGKDNFTRLKTALAGNDDTDTPSNYPGFNFGNNYKTQTNSNVSGTSYESGWYLPSMVELFYFYKNLTTINAAAALYGITYPGTALLSSSLPYDSNTSVCYFASNGQPYTNSNRQDTRGAIAIHEF